jgi:hypothetical protein
VVPAASDGSSERLALLASLFLRLPAWAAIVERSGYGAGEDDLYGADGAHYRDDAVDCASRERYPPSIWRPGRVSVPGLVVRESVNEPRSNVNGFYFRVPDPDRQWIGSVSVGDVDKAPSITVPLEILVWD